MKKKILILLFIAEGMVLAGGAYAQCQNHNIYGWAWSENIGWISFSCRNTVAEGAGVNFGVDVNSVTGKLSGYAWSRGTDADVGGIGWIRFDPSSADGYPAGGPNYSACLDLPASISTSEPCNGVGDYTVSGWARACAVFPDGSCGGVLRPDSERGGWDGWIKLRGTALNGSPYGVTLNTSPTPKEFQGWAWGSDVVGWISFNKSNTGAASNYKVMTDFSIDNSPYIDSAVRLPADYCSSSPTGLISFEWTYKDNEGDSQGKYNLQIATDVGFNNLVVDYTGDQPVPAEGKGTSAINVVQSPTPQINDLDIGYTGPGVTYRWRVRVKAATGNQEWSASVVGGPNFSTPSSPYPNPKFTISSENPPAGVEVTFTDDSDCYTGFAKCKNDSNTSYHWFFGDGDEATNTKEDGYVTHTYQSQGPKTVRLEVTDIIGGEGKMCFEENLLTAAFPLPIWKEIAPF